MVEAGGSRLWKPGSLEAFINPVPRRAGQDLMGGDRSFWATHLVKGRQKLLDSSVDLLLLQTTAGRVAADTGPGDSSRRERGSCLGECQSPYDGLLDDGTGCRAHGGGGSKNSGAEHLGDQLQWKRREIVRRRVGWIAIERADESSQGDDKFLAKTRHAEAPTKARYLVRAQSCDESQIRPCLLTDDTGIRKE